MCLLPSFPSLHSITDCKVVGWEARAAVAQDTCWVGGRGGLTPAPAHTCAIVCSAEAGGGAEGHGEGRVIIMR